MLVVNFCACTVASESSELDQTDRCTSELLLVRFDRSAADSGGMNVPMFSFVRLPGEKPTVPRSEWLLERFASTRVNVVNAFVTCRSSSGRLGTSTEA